MEEDGISQLSEKHDDNYCDVVTDDELLYRRIYDNSNNYVVDQSTGRVRLSSTAFSEKGSRPRPSVDRAKLNGSDPTRTQKNATDGVVSIKANQVRQQRFTLQPQQQKVPIEFVADVEPVPTPDNPAHAEIFATPAINEDNRGAFKKLTDRLAREALLWEIPPASLR